MSALFLWRCLFRIQAMMTLNGAFVSLVLLLSSLPPECPCPPRQPRGRLSDHVSQTRDLTDPLELVGQHGQPSVFAVFTAWDLPTADSICVLFCPASHTAL